MDRADFLKNVLGAAVAPALIKDFLIDEENAVAFSKGEHKKFAIDLNCIHNVGITGQGKLRPAEVLELFKQTGILIYRRPAGYPDDFNPITILE